MKTTPYHHNLWTAPDWQPPAVLRTPARREAPIPRNDLKPTLALSTADLARVDQVGPEVSSGQLEAAMADQRASNTINLPSIKRGQQRRRDTVNARLRVQRVHLKERILERLQSRAGQWHSAADLVSVIGCSESHANKLLRDLSAAGKCEAKRVTRRGMEYRIAESGA